VLKIDGLREIADGWSVGSRRPACPQLRLACGWRPCCLFERKVGKRAHCPSGVPAAPWATALPGDVAQLRQHQQQLTGPKLAGCCQQIERITPASRCCGFWLTAR